MLKIKNLAFPLLFLLCSYPAFSQILTGEELEVRLLIIGQGDPVYSLWGHTGIAIKNIDNGRDVFYDFGNFYFEDDDFFKNFAIGRLLYIAWAAHTEPYIRSVIGENRDITEYDLNLSPESRLKMYEALKEKSLPENRTYLYHHYNDNCSTRIRDYINDAIGGQLFSQTDRPRGETFRKRFLLFTTNRPFAGSMLSLLQGPSIDKDITVWQEMFLPQVLEEVIADLSYTDAAGQTVPLVKKKTILYKSELRKTIPSVYKPPFRASVLISLIIFSLTLYVNIRSYRKKRIAFSLLNIIAGLFLGITGAVLLFLAVFTDHTYSYNNFNLFMINPLALFLIPAAVLFWKKGEPVRGKLNLIWMIQLISTIVMILIKILTPVKQFNHIEIIIILPMLMAFSPLIPAFLKKRGLLG